MYQTIDKQVVQTDKETEAGHAGDKPGKDITHLILHKVALQPVCHVTGGFIGTALRHGGVLTELEHALHIVMPRTGLRFRFAALFCQQVLNRTVQAQIRITADW